MKAFFFLKCGVVTVGGGGVLLAVPRSLASLYQLNA